MTALPPAVTSLRSRLDELGWVKDLLVAGSLATGDYVPGVSDLDLVAIVDGPVDAVREAALVDLHQGLDSGPAAGAQLGCAYVAESTIPLLDAVHPTWTHAQFVHRRLSGIARAELVHHGFAVCGRPPGAVLPPMTDDQVRAAARAELAGYWAWASRRPWMWLDPVIADLGLTAMARGRYTMRTGRLLTKTEAIEQAHAPDWLVDQLRARRRGDRVASPRLRTGWIAWRDARRTIGALGGHPPVLG
ncbi:nucleotidyltransferase domain-containing protein [Nocardioides koreensis]|uniref:Nucleotidyltransferase domain-containing protein n=1 Tax=Nocardioides koreensis TaxID=433651 RepID=A0ABN2Z228_9ACTN